MPLEEKIVKAIRSWNVFGDVLFIRVRFKRHRNDVMIEFPRTNILERLIADAVITWCRENSVEEYIDGIIESAIQ